MTRMGEAEKIYREKAKKLKKQAKTDWEKHIVEYREKVKKMGIIKFIESLPCPPFSQDEEGITPEFILLEPWQESWFLEIEVILRALLTAGRGAGKTFCVALLVLYELIIYDYYTINVIGGSLNQTENMQSYLDFFRDNVPEIGYILPRSLYGLKPRITSRYHSKCVFLPTSPTGARGPRANRLIIDEYCTGEAKSKLGAKSLKAAVHQLRARRNAKLLLTSTSDYVRGRFYEILQNPKKFKYKVHIWSTARHISGKASRFVYTDKDPSHWQSNCWWIQHSQIQTQRLNSSDAEWMVEVLGGVSMASGFVYDVDDLDVAECKLCDVCKPYKWGHCKLIDMFGLGNEEDPIKLIVSRKSGFDYGMPAPCALIIVGRKGNVIFILFADEVKGLRTTELTSWVSSKLLTFKCFDFIPDPSAPSESFSQNIEDLGFARIVIDAQKKYERIETTRNFMERKLFIIPKAYWRLMKSLKNACFDNKGKVIKKDDHSFDTLCYACSDYRQTLTPVFDLSTKEFERLGKGLDLFPTNEG